MTDIGPDDPVPLATAARLFFPAGGVSISSLRTEIRHGRLVVERIAGRDFVTKRAIDEMRSRCRVNPREQDSISAKPEAIEPRHGSSKIEAGRSQREATRATANRLKKGSPTISPENTKLPEARVIPIR
jgi:hypothetical protein